MQVPQQDAASAESIRSIKSLYDGNSLKSESLIYMALQLCHAKQTRKDQLPDDFCILVLVEWATITHVQNHYTKKKDKQENTKIAM